MALRCVDDDSVGLAGFADRIFFMRAAMAPSHRRPRSELVMPEGSAWHPRLAPRHAPSLRLLACWLRLSVLLRR